MMIRHILFALPIALFAPVLTGCGAPAGEGADQEASAPFQHEEHPDHADHRAHEGHSDTATSSTKPADDPRKAWPALYTLDDLGHRAEFQIEEEEWDELRATLTEMVAPTEEILESTPEGIERSKEMIFALGELESILKKFNNLPADADLQLVASFAMSMKAITEKMMETAGLPHVHADH